MIHVRVRYSHSRMFICRPQPKASRRKREAAIRSNGEGGTPAGVDPGSRAPVAIRGSGTPPRAAVALEVLRAKTCNGSLSPLLLTAELLEDVVHAPLSASCLRQLHLHPPEPSRATMAPFMTSSQTSGLAPPLLPCFWGGGLCHTCPFPVHHPM